MNSPVFLAVADRTPPGANAPAAPAPAPAPACRAHCAACCIAPSINSPIPGMPHGKPAGVPCVQLDDAGRCRLFGRPERPSFCASLQPRADMCGEDRAQALALLAALERATAPDDGHGRGDGDVSITR